MTNHPFCSIIIPAFNEQKNIARCLQSLNKQSYPRSKYEIIVIDNGSTDSTKLIAGSIADTVLEILDCNVGAVRNFGAKHASGEIFIFTDADCIVGYDWIQTGVDLILNNPNSIFGGGLKPQDNPSWIERYWLLNDNGEVLQQKDLMGSSIFISSANFKALGGFSSSITSGEDTDLSIRARNLGFHIILKKNLSLIHLGNPETIYDFVKRQSWHSENYLINMKHSLTDKVFWLTITYASTLIILFINTNPTIIVLYLLLTQTSPLILSIKRAYRGDQFYVLLKHPFQMLLIDNLYLIGRLIGLFKGIGRLKNRKRSPKKHN